MPDDWVIDDRQDDWDVDLARWTAGRKLISTITSSLLLISWQPIEFLIVIPVGVSPLNHHIATLGISRVSTPAETLASVPRYRARGGPVASAMRRCEYALKAPVRIRSRSQVADERASRDVESPNHLKMALSGSTGDRDPEGFVRLRLTLTLMVGAHGQIARLAPFRILSRPTIGGIGPRFRSIRHHASQRMSTDSVYNRASTPVRRSLMVKRWRHPSTFPELAFANFRDPN